MPKSLFAGSRTDCVSVVGGTISESTDYINGAYSDAGINIRSGTAKIQFYDPAAAPLLAPYSVEAGHVLYFHAYIGLNYPGFGFSGQALVFFDNAGYPWLLVTYNGQWQYNSGTGPAPAWTNFGDNIIGFPGHQTGQAPMDIRIAIDAGGNHTLSMGINGNTAVAAVVFNQPLMTNLSFAQFNGDVNEVVWSEILVSEDISTVNGHVYTKRGTGAGAHAEWTGDVTDVNEVITNDANSNSATAAGLAQSYVMGAIVVPDGYEVLDVFHWLRGKNSGTSPENIQSLMRTEAAVDHLSGNLPGPGIFFSQFGARYGVNPDTTVAWAAGDTLELGFVSEA